MDENITQPVQKSFFKKNMWWIILVVVLVIMVSWAVGKYNSFVVLGQDVDAQWAQVENQLQRRFDLIPNLEASVKGSFAQEKEVFGAIALARTQYANAKTTNEKAMAATAAESAIGRLLAVVESYPQLASISAVRDLMTQLEGTENRISVERGKFNQKIQALNSSIKQFPTNIMAGIFGVKERAYFNAPLEAQTAPKVNL